jgi:hypothetical protein
MTVWFSFRVLLLAGMIVWSLVPQLGLMCQPELYRKFFKINSNSLSNLRDLCTEPLRIGGGLHLKEGEYRLMQECRAAQTHAQTLGKAWGAIPLLTAIGY